MKQDYPLESLKQKIAAEVPFIGIKPYSHNIIGLVLAQIAQNYGYNEANRCIDEFGLEEKGWRKVKHQTNSQPIDDSFKQELLNQFGPIVNLINIYYTTGITNQSRPIVHIELKVRIDQEVPPNKSALLIEIKNAIYKIKQELTKVCLGVSHLPEPRGIQVQGLTIYANNHIPEYCILVHPSLAASLYRRIQSATED